MSTKRLTKLKTVTDTIDELEAELSLHKQEIHKLNLTLNTIQSDQPLEEYIKIREERNNDKCGGALTWPFWIQQLILEFLVNGTPPSAIRSNILSHVSITAPCVIIHELPSNIYIRNCRTSLRIIGETLTSCRLAKKNNWQQLFTDGTSRR